MQASEAFAAIWSEVERLIGELTKTRARPE
jgi:hypothetical protein